VIPVEHFIEFKAADIDKILICIGDTSLEICFRYQKLARVEGVPGVCNRLIIFHRSGSFEKNFG
jgi:hypothetical protein